MIADAFSPVNILEQGAQMAKGEQSRMVRPLPSTRVPGRSARAAAHERARAHAHLRLAPTPRPPRATLIPRQSSICGALAVADLVKTSLGPKGMDKILQSSDRAGNVSVTNDGATILKSVLIDVRHPTAQPHPFPLPPSGASQDLTFNLRHH